MKIVEKIEERYQTENKKEHPLTKIAKMAKDVGITDLAKEKVLGTRPETETIETVLEKAISEAEANERIMAAQNKFLKTAVKEALVIKDVFGRLEKK